MTSLIDFARANPLVMTAIVWPLLSALLTAVFKPRTEEQYVALAVKHPRLADFWRFIGAIGFDPVKAVQMLARMLTPVAELPTVVTITVPPAPIENKLNEQPLI